jgi:hypothetical protein
MMPKLAQKRRQPIQKREPSFLMVDDDDFHLRILVRGLPMSIRDELVDRPDGGINTTTYPHVPHDDLGRGHYVELGRVILAIDKLPDDLRSKERKWFAEAVGAGLLKPRYCD